MTQADSAFAELLDRRRGGEPGFVAALRASGRDAFARAKLPTTRHEDWRYTNLASLTERPFSAASPRRVDVGDLPPAPRLVFVNGVVDRAASDLGGLPRGARAGSLAAALRERPAVLEPLLGRVVPMPDHAFVALNAGLFEDGALVELEDGVSCDTPIHLVFVSVDAARAASHPRNLVVLGKDARATVVEHYRGEGCYLVNAVTEVALGDAASLEHDRLQEDAPESFHVGVVQVAQRARSRFTGQSIALGSQLARVEARALLAAEDAACDLNGLYVGAEQQVLDHFVHVDHASPRCTSREVFKGILDGRARGVFTGRVLVREDAQKSDAGQVNSNLLLSEDATVNTKPQLEIFADDVKASHGGSVGQLREDQLFYLRSRGLDEALARATLTWAFASDMVRRVGPEDVRRRVRRAVTARLRNGLLLNEVEA